MLLHYPSISYYLIRVYVKDEGSLKIPVVQGGWGRKTMDGGWSVEREKEREREEK